MKVPLLDLTAQFDTLRDDAFEAIRGVCESQQFILGPEVEAFEQEVAAFCGVEHAVGMSSGTDALLAALMALDVGPGDEIVTSTFSFFATAGVISRLAAQPVFVDIESDGFNLDPEATAAAIGPRTKAVIPVHLFGCMARLDPIVEAASRWEVPVIEDAAQALSSVDRAGRPAGSVGDFGCFSFFPSKNLGGFGDGGMTVARDADLAERLRLIRVHGAGRQYHHRMVGGNFRLDALQAAVLRVKLPHLAGWSAARRDNAERYRELFATAGLGGTVRLPEDEPGHVYNQFVVRVPRRDQLKAHLAAADVGSAIYYPIPLHLQECFAHLGYPEGSLPRSEAVAADCLALPVYPELSDDQLAWVVDRIAAFYG